MRLLRTGLLIVLLCTISSVAHAVQGGGGGGGNQFTYSTAA
jgi:hypothetical protein